MNRTELLNAVNSHPRFNPDCLQDMAQGKLTNTVLWRYLCSLEGWEPLEVVATNNPDWYLVASSSEIDVWHKTSVMHQSCDCLHNSNNKCCHLSALERHEEMAWISLAKQYGFSVVLHEGKYQIKDYSIVVGELHFCGDKWLLKEPTKRDYLVYDGIHEAIEYLAAVASFGSQLA